MSNVLRLARAVLALAAMVLPPVACTSTPTLSPDGGAADGGDAGSGASDAHASATALACFAGNGSTLIVTFAIPKDFSVNTETGEDDQHDLVITAGDFFAHRTNYTTGGLADHQHEVHFTAEQIAGIQTNVGYPRGAETGPPLNAINGHTHTVNLTHCGLPGD